MPDPPSVRSRADRRLPRGRDHRPGAEVVAPRPATALLCGARRDRSRLRAAGAARSGVLACGAILGATPMRPMRRRTRSSPPGASCRACARSDRFDPWLRRILVERVPDAAPAGPKPLAARADPDRAGALGRRSPLRLAIEALDLLERAFERIDPDDRVLVALHILERRSLAEMADALRMPATTAKVRLHEAREALHRAMGFGMITPDRTEELVLEMLERRASAPPPWLVDETIRAGRRVSQRRTAKAGPVASSGHRRRRSGRGHRRPLSAASRSAPASLGTTVASSPQPSATSDSSPRRRRSATEVAVRSPTAPPTPAATVRRRRLAAGRFDCRRHDRWRRAPGSQCAGGRRRTPKRLRPLLADRHRMLVRRRPGDCGRLRVVPGADRREPDRLAGWVAAGDDGVPWIRAGKPRCPAELGRAALSAARRSTCCSVFGTVRCRLLFTASATMTVRAAISERIGWAARGRRDGSSARRYIDLGEMRGDAAWRNRSDLHTGCGRLTRASRPRNWAPGRRAHGHPIVRRSRREACRVRRTTVRSRSSRGRLCSPAGFFRSSRRSSRAGRSMSRSRSLRQTYAPRTQALTRR